VSGSNPLPDAQRQYREQALVTAGNTEPVKLALNVG
jgi:hypothetical protein